MTREEFDQKWSRHLAHFEKFGSSVSAAPLLAEVLADLERADREAGAELLNLTQAGQRCGYSPDTLSRMIRQGRLANYGRANAPRLRAADLPRKPLRSKAQTLQVAGASRQTARVSNTTPRGGR